MKQKIYRTDEEIAAYLRAEGARLVQEFGLVPPWALKNTRLEPLPVFIEFWKEAQEFLGDWPVVYEADQFDLTFKNGVVGIIPLVMYEEVNNLSFEALDAWMRGSGFGEDLSMLISDIDLQTTDDTSSPLDLENSASLVKINSRVELDSLIAKIIHMHYLRAPKSASAPLKVLNWSAKEALEYASYQSDPVELYLCGRMIFSRFDQPPRLQFLRNCYVDVKVVLIVPTSSLTDSESGKMSAPVRAIAFHFPDSNYCLPFLTIAN